MAGETRCRRQALVSWVLFEGALVGSVTRRPLRGREKGFKKPPLRARQSSAAERAESPQGGLSGNPSGERVPGVWLASFKLPLAVHGEVGKSARGALRCGQRRERTDNGSGSRAVSSSPSRGLWAAVSSGGMPSDAEECIEMCLPLVLSLAPCRGGGCCPRPPLPWRLGRPGTIAGP